MDVAGLTKLVQLVLKVQQRMERWHSFMSIGEWCCTAGTSGRQPRHSCLLVMCAAHACVHQMLLCQAIYLEQAVQQLQPG